MQLGTKVQFLTIQLQQKEEYIQSNEESLECLKGKTSKEIKHLGESLELKEKEIYELKKKVKK